MKLSKFIIALIIVSCYISSDIYAKGPENSGNYPKPDMTGWRAACVRPTKAIDMEVNNVRARLKTGGDIWNISQNGGGYIVPKPAPNQPAVSAIYAGGVWIGGVDRAGAIKLSAVTYSSEGADFYSGPLDLTGNSEAEICRNWDRFFTVKGENVRNHINYILKTLENGREINCDSIPDDVKYWPGQGNPHWRDKYNFTLPDQELAGYWDFDGDGKYTPCGGDWPIIEIRGCEPGPPDANREAQELVPDEMVFWIYNDKGGPQSLSGPKSIQMEVQVQSFAYATNDEINDMTFYRYKLINKASEDLIDCYFSMWIDPDLGCYSDDYIGCDIKRSMAYVYNQDAVDGNNGSACGGTNTYGSDIPILGMDYFRGPRGPKVFKVDSDGNYLYEPSLDVNGDTIKVNGVIQYKKILLEPEPYTGQQDTLVELGMTSFAYHEGVGAANPGMGDPQRGREDGFYNLIRGIWQDGTPYTRGGNGYNPGSTDTVKYVFPNMPNEPGWSMCTAALPFADRRTLQATGPLLLQQGAKNELIMGVVYVPSLTYPCPDIKRLQNADDIAQALFDNCFDITDGPDAPDVTSVELDQEIILMLSNETTSNNFNESYAEVDLQAPLATNGENEYRFEGYRIYQVANASITSQELSDITKARPIVQVDLKNGIKEIYNWTGQTNPLDENGPVVWTPTKEVSGVDEGISKTFKVTEDQFALTNRKLVNHKQYHFIAIAYAYNNWQKFDIIKGEGQKRAYLEGRGNIGVNGSPYTFVPRPIVYEQLQAKYGDGPQVTRIAGEGNPGKFLEMDDTMYELILKKTNDGKILYKSGAGPIDAKVVDPLKIKDGKYRLEITGNFSANAASSTCAFDDKAVWKLSNVTDPSKEVVLLNNRSLTEVKEYIVNNLGFSVTVKSESDPGSTRKGTNGGIDATLTYKNAAGDKWFNAIKDGGIYQEGENISNIRVLDIARNGYSQDPLSALTKLGDGYFIPFLSTRFGTDLDLPYYLSPAARDIMAILTSDNAPSLRFRDLNNVDIVFTSDKSKWSKCIVVETAFNEQFDLGLESIGNAKNFEMRLSPSIDENGNEIPNSTGFSYFPGYAIDVETGKRLNIFFGENSIFSGANAQFMQGGNPIGGDMIFNPSTELLIQNLLNSSVPTDQVIGLIAGAQHAIYVTRMEYDGCAAFADRLKRNPTTGAGPSIINKSKVGAAVTWTALPVLSSPLLPLDKGLIPNDMTVKLRVNNPYSESRKYTTEKEKNCETDGDQPVYEFEFKGTESKQLATEDDYVGALANVNVVPNPYYAYSAYETSQFTNVVKITNLPAKAIVTIYSIDGSFIRQYNRDERGAILSGNNRPTSTSQVYPDLEWDMKNFKDIPVASGVYLIHIEAPEYGEERTLKWFGISRKFDPSGL